MENIVYSTSDTITPEEFVDVLAASTLGERRPIDDAACVAGMVKHAGLVVTARVDGKLVGVARSVTDFHYCCYLSDLAVDTEYQRRGVGRRLIELTNEQLGPKCSLILLAAPAAIDYYPRVGFQHHPQAWIMTPKDR
jgi:predicted N-acetyltransferase YhbS